MEAYKPAIETDEQIAALSSFIEDLPDPQSVRHGAGDNLDQAKAQFVDLCVSCHGTEGAGSRDDAKGQCDVVQLDEV